MLSPIKRSILVSWNQREAYRHFVEDFGAWWPRRTCTIGGRRIKRIVFETKLHGLIFEEHADGTRFEWGRVTRLEAPNVVAFTFHASRDEADSQHVEITFTPEKNGTRVELTSSNWDALGDAARRAYGGFKLSWTTILSTFGKQFTPSMLFFEAMALAIDLTGQRGSFVKGSRGRMPARDD